MISMYQRVCQEVGLLKQALFRGRKESIELKSLVENLEPFYNVRNTYSAYEKGDIQGLIEEAKDMQRRIGNIIYHYGKVPRVRCTINKLEDRLQALLNWQPALHEI